MRDKARDPFSLSVFRSANTVLGGNLEYVPKGRKPLPLFVRFWTKVDRSDPSGCWLWTGYRNESGYGRMLDSGPRRLVYVHRVAYQHLVGPIPAGMSVLHRCDNPPCVNPAHLFVGTQADNMADCAAKGRIATGVYPAGARVRRGESVASSKLTATEVLEIRARYAAGSVTQQQLASEYGVCQRTVCVITRREGWAHV